MELLARKKAAVPFYIVCLCIVVAVAGSIMLMPGLGKHPAAERIYVDEKGEIEGLS